MPDDTINVRLPLPRGVAERLRKMCHAKGVPASELITRWIGRHDDAGNEIDVTSSRLDTFMDSFLGEARRKGGR